MPDQSLAFDHHQPPLTIARELAADYVNALAIFLAGSVIREDVTPTSDLDIVIVTTEDPAAAYRKSIIKGGWPVELFVHTPASLKKFFQSDICRRRPSLPNMCAEALIVSQQNGHADQIKTHAKKLLQKGPAAFTADEIERQRYFITDLLMDLEGSRALEETFFIAMSLAEHAADFYLGYHQQWSGKGKWLWRALHKTAPEKAAALKQALKDCFQGQKEPLSLWVKDCLEEAGGPLFAGFYQGT